MGYDANSRRYRADTFDFERSGYMMFPDASFEAVMSFYAVIHVPLDEQPGLLRRVARWLTSGGLFLAVLGHTAWTGTEENWHGAPLMYWSHADAATYRAWLAEAGFAVLTERFLPEGDGGHTLFIARKRQAA